MAWPQTQAPADCMLERAIGRWDLVAMVLNSVIGAGIFGLPSLAFALSGTYSLFAFAICAALVFLFILCFAEVASRFCGTGGPYLYARAAFGRFAGFEMGWLLWLTRITAFGSLTNLLVGYLSIFWPAAAEGWARRIVITGLIGFLTALNLVGVRSSRGFHQFHDRRQDDGTCDVHRCRSFLYLAFCLFAGKGSDV